MANSPSSYTKTNVPGLVKDNKSGAVVATSDGDYQRILARRKEKAALEKTHDEMIRMRRELDQALTDIKKLKEAVGL